jgi:hypothetical protein
MFSLKYFAVDTLCAFWLDTGMVVVQLTFDEDIGLQIVCVIYCQ